MAPPSKLTPEVHAKIVNLVRAGNYIETAAGACGITSRIIRYWMHRGAEDLEAGRDTPQARLTADINMAYEQAETIAIAIINKAAASGEVRAIQWKLERMRPERFAQQVNVTHQVKQDLADDLLERLRSRLDEATFARVVEALVDDGGEEGDPEERQPH